MIHLCLSDILKLKRLPLGELGFFYGGLSGKSKEDFVNGNGRFIPYMNVYSNLSVDMKKLGSVKVAEGERQNKVEYGDMLFTGSSETPDECGMSSVMLEKSDDENPVYLNSFCFGFRFNDLSQIYPAFFMHLFRSNKIRKEISRTANGVTRFNISKKLFAKIQIPFPTLEQQKVIADNLNAFTTLISNLDEEINLREKQFYFYHNEFFEELDDDFYSIGELFEFKNGLNKEKKYFGEGTPIVNYTDVYKNRFLTNELIKGRVTLTESEIERFNVKRGDVFFTRTSETQEEVGISSVLLDDIEHCTFSGFLLRARPKTNLILPEFCKYCFSTYKMRIEIIRYSSFTTRALTNGPSLSRIKLRLPSLDKQRSIVEKLDAFTSLISKLQDERDLRQKQYEYYREKLLTFE